MAINNTLSLPHHQSIATIDVVVSAVEVVVGVGHRRAVGDLKRSREVMCHLAADVILVEVKRVVVVTTVEERVVEVVVHDVVATIFLCIHVIEIEGPVQGVVLSGELLGALEGQRTGRRQRGWWGWSVSLRDPRRGGAPTVDSCRVVQIRCCHCCSRCGCCKWCARCGVECQRGSHHRGWVGHEG